jgi:putative inorganic carbon (hco3(-)) transporter
VALLIVGSLSLLTLADPTFAPDSARAYRWVIVEPVLLYFLLTDIIGSRRGLWRVADFFVAAAVGVALLGIWQFLRGGDTVDVQGVSRVLSVYKHPNNLALYLGRLLPFAACVGLFLPRGPRKTLYLLACVPIGITTVLTYSRGAWAAVTLAVILAVAAGFYWRPGSGSQSPDGSLTPRRDRWILFASSAALVLGLALIAAPTLLPKLPPRILNIGSGVLRVGIWQSSLRMLADHPIFGVGPDQFLNQFQAHYITLELEKEPYTAHPHNLVLDYWLSLGIMGLLILVWLLWRYFREAIGAVQNLARGPGRDPAYRALALGLLAGMLDFLLHGLVDNSYFLMDLALIFWLSCGLMQTIRKT